MSKFYSFIGRYGTAFIAGMWLAVTIGNLILWTHESKISAVFTSQLFVAWALIHNLEESSRRGLEKSVNFGRRG